MAKSKKIEEFEPIVDDEIPEEISEEIEQLTEEALDDIDLPEIEEVDEAIEAAEEEFAEEESEEEVEEEALMGEEEDPDASSTEKKKPRRSRKKMAEMEAALLAEQEELDRLATEAILKQREERRHTEFVGSKLTWLVDDFSGITTSVYEAVMVAANRARQIGRRQKREIDAFNASIPLTAESIEEEETSLKGIDHFQHVKPTIEALSELKQKLFKFKYPEETAK